MQIKVAIVDDDEGIRSSLATLIRRAPSLRLAGEYPDAETAVKEIPRRPPDVVLMDINLPGMNGVECVRQLKAALPSTQFLMLTVYEDSDSLFNSLKAGASGYLLKRTASARLLEAIRDVHAGGSPMTPQLARRVVQFFSRPAPGNSRDVRTDAGRKRISRSTGQGLRLQGDCRPHENQHRHRAQLCPRRSTKSFTSTPGPRRW